MNDRPPLGLRPRYVVNTLRQQEILEAMQRYAAFGAVIPRHWIDELSDLCDWLRDFSLSAEEVAATGENVARDTSSRL